MVNLLCEAGLACRLRDPRHPRGETLNPGSSSTCIVLAESSAAVVLLSHAERKRRRFRGGDFAGLLGGAVMTNQTDPAAVCPTQVSRWLAEAAARGAFRTCTWWWAIHPCCACTGGSTSCPNPPWTTRRHNACSRRCAQRRRSSSSGPSTIAIFRSSCPLPRSCIVFAPTTS